MVIVEASEVTDELVDAFRKLIPQLGPNQEPPERNELEEIVSSPNVILFLAREDEGQGPIIGSAALAFYRTPAVKHFRIEDVVVDGSARGRGVGEALVRAALDRARSLGATRVDLTSAPAREAANRLYRRMGFEQRQTNVYRYHIGS